MKCPIRGVRTTNQGTYVHLRFVGPYDKGTEVLRWIRGVCGLATRVGPYTDDRMYPKVDTERFLILAHIPIEEEA